MSSRRRLRRKCRAKVAYRTEDDARLAVGRMKDGGVAGRLSAYRCPFGAHWHVGNTPARIRVAVDARKGEGHA